MGNYKRPLTAFGVEVTIFCARYNISCAEIADKAEISRVALSEVMHGKRSGTKKIIPAVRKFMATHRPLPKSLAK